MSAGGDAVGVTMGGCREDAYYFASTLKLDGFVCFFSSLFSGYFSLSHPQQTHKKRKCRSGKVGQ